MRVFGSKLSPTRMDGLRFLRKVANELAQAYEERAAKEKGLMFSVARDLEVNRSAIYRRLAGEANMTATTIGELASALGLKPNDRVFVPDLAEPTVNEVPAVRMVAQPIPAFVQTPVVEPGAMSRDPKAIAAAKSMGKLQAEWRVTPGSIGILAGPKAQAPVESSAA